MSKQKKIALIICASILGFLLILFVVCAIYVSDFYEADDSIIGDTSDIRYLDDGSIVIGEGCRRSFLNTTTNLQLVSHSHIAERGGVCQTDLQSGYYKLLLL